MYIKLKNLKQLKDIAINLDSVEINEYGQKTIILSYQNIDILTISTDYHDCSTINLSDKEIKVAAKNFKNKKRLNRIFLRKLKAYNEHHKNSKKNLDCCNFDYHNTVIYCSSDIVEIETFISDYNKFLVNYNNQVYDSFDYIKDYSSIDESQLYHNEDYDNIAIINDEYITGITFAVYNLQSKNIIYKGKKCKLICTKRGYFDLIPFEVLYK